MTIRTAETKDLEKVLGLYQHLFLGEDYSQTENFLEKWQEIVNQPGLVFFLLEKAGQALATAHLSIVPNLSRGQRPYGLVENVVVHPEHRRQGLGKRIMEYVMDFAKASNCYRLMLLSTSSHDREAAQDFYVSLGFDGDSKRGFVKKFPNK